MKLDLQQYGIGSLNGAIPIADGGFVKVEDVESMLGDLLRMRESFNRIASFVSDLAPAYHLKENVSLAFGFTNNVADVVRDFEKGK